MIEPGVNRLEETHRDKHGCYYVSLGRIRAPHLPLCDDVLHDLHNRVRSGRLIGECGQPSIHGDVSTRHVTKVAVWTSIHMERASFVIDSLDVEHVDGHQCFSGRIRSLPHHADHNLDAFIKEHRPAVLRFCMRALAKPAKVNQSAVEISHVVTFDLLTRFVRGTKKK